MPKWVRGVAIAAGAVAAVAGLVVGGSYVVTRQKLTRRYDIPRELLTVASPEQQDPHRGFAVAVVHACTHCHGPDLGGGVMPELAALGTVVAPNLTRGGLTDKFSNEDWARVIRHSVRPDGTPVLFMPSNHNFLDMTDEDVAAIIRYARTRPPVKRDLPKMRFGAFGYIALATGAVGIETETMDHTTKPYHSEPGITYNNGRHLAQMCTSCHGNDLGGIPPGLGHARPGPNLTTAGPLKDWDEAGFIRFIRTGRTPPGRYLDPQGMPWKAFALLSEEELKSLWKYIHEAPPVDRRVGAPQPAKSASR